MKIKEREREREYLEKYREMSEKWEKERKKK